MLLRVCCWTLICKTYTFVYGKIKMINPKIVVFPWLSFKVNANPAWTADSSGQPKCPTAGRICPKWSLATNCDASSLTTRIWSTKVASCRNCRRGSPFSTSSRRFSFHSFVWLFKLEKYRDTLAGGNASPHENYIEQSGHTNNPLLNPTSENLQRSALGMLWWMRYKVISHQAFLTISRRPLAPLSSTSSSARCSTNCTRNWKSRSWKRWKMKVRRRAKVNK